MQYALILAAAALAQAREHAHGRFHNAARRDLVTVVDVVTEVVTAYVTAGVEPTTSTSSSSSSTSVTTEGHWNIPTSSSSSSSSSSTATPSSYSSSSSSAPAYSSPSSTWTTLVSSTSASSSAAKSTSTGGFTSVTGGKKAGLSGYVGINTKSAFAQFAPYISWYSDYTATTPDSNGVKGVGMLWGGNGSPCGSEVVQRLEAFTSLISTTTPSIMFGFYEPDCNCPDSAEMSTAEAASDWDTMVAPLKLKGTILGSPSMCKQYNEDFLTPFQKAISNDWDVTSIHINKPSLDEVKKDVEYYASTYGKPIWVSEFACVNDNPSWEPCTDQTQINNFIQEVVQYFESNSDVIAYGPSNGNGLGNVWPLTDSNGDLTESGQTYLNAIKNV
jgi:hypothetical protein